MDLVHASEMRRCLIQADVAGIKKLWQHIAPHLANQSAVDSLTCLHMARVEAKYIPIKLKAYSLAFVEERGLRKIDGQWIQGLPKEQAIAAAVGLASKSRNPAFAKKIVQAMSDAVMNGLAKGVTEPPMQRELILKAREKVRFKAGFI